MQNDGRLPAEGVKVAIDSRHDSLLIQGKKETRIGTIPANKSGETVRFQILAKRSIKVGEARLAIAITQDEFESRQDQYALNIQEEGAVVVDMDAESKTKVMAKTQEGPKIKLIGRESAVFPPTAEESLRLAFEVSASSSAIAGIKLLVNGRAIPTLNEGIGQQLKTAKNKKTIPILLENIPLDEGENSIILTAYNSDNVPAQPQKISIVRTAEEGVDEAPLTGLNNPNAVAVVIGISRFKNKDIPKVAYARHDAETVKKYLVRTLGFSEKNIEEFYDEEATATDLKSYFATKLRRKVKQGVTEVFVFYSGHGTPDTNSQEPYLVPYDFDSTDPVNTGLAANVLYEQIAELGARSATIVLDSCFSGKSSDGKLLIKNISPGMLISKDPFFSVQNGVLFAAASKEQPASWYDKKQHGLFTYYFLQGLRGGADYDKDGSLTVEELSRYVRMGVSEQARTLYNREQTPEAKGDPKAVVVRYK